VSPFFTLGLSALPQETAEEILVKAHARDAEAATLAVVGYSLGMGGFPHNEEIAFNLVRLIDNMGARQRAAFLYAYLDRENKIESEKYKDLGQYTIGRQSILAQRFKQAGLFDIEQRIKEITPAEKDKKKILLEDNKESIKLWSYMFERDKQLRRMIDHFSYTMVTAEGARTLKNIMRDNNDKDMCLFYAETSHDQNESPPVFDNVKLLNFIDIQYKMRDKKRIYTLQAEASRLLKNRLLFDQQYALAIIRKAHGGDITAIRQMARNYSTGDMNFIKDDQLSVVWLSLGAYAGDALCQVLFASDLYRMVNWPLNAWAWAKIAEERGDDQIARIAVLIQKQIESQASPADMVLARDILQKHRKNSTEPCIK